MAKQFKREEVKNHNHNQSAWVIINNYVYDVTAFLNEHPGGEEVLLEQSGGDGSEAFEDVGHSSDARELMVKYRIGEIIESERKSVTEKTNEWPTTTSDMSTPQSSMKSWILPVALGILATVIYHCYF